jgi:hypothetical protein
VDPGGVNLKETKKEAKKEKKAGNDNRDAEGE